MSAVPDQFIGSGSGPLQPPGDQWLRKWALKLGGAGNNLVLSTSDQGYDVRIKFEVRQADAQTPNTCIVRCYNLADATAVRAVKEYTTLQLEAGYINGKFGEIFSGSIKQFKIGRESPTEKFLDIFAADGDIAYNQATMNKVLAAGSSAQDRMNAINQSWQAGGAQVSGISPFTLKEQILPRPRVYYGMVADETRTFTKTQDMAWNIEGGKIVYTPFTAYGNGDVVVINSATGMIGFPESSNDGIVVTTLLNPAIRLRQRLQLDNKSLNLYFAPGGSPTGQAGVVFPGYATGVNYYPSPAADGLYCALVLDYSGDTRGTPWYTIITALAVDPSSGQGAAVKALG